MRAQHNTAIYLDCAILLYALAIGALAQQSQPTIRHHRVAEPAEQTSNPELDQAEIAMQRGDFAAAEPLLKNAISKDVTSYRTWFDLGYVYNALQRPADAIEAYRKAVAAKPDVFESNLNLGLLLAKAGQNAEAAKYLKSATELKPSSQEALARAWLGLGHVEEATDPQQALLAYGEAAKLNPRGVEPHLAAAVLLQQQNNLDAAAREYQAAAQLEPASSDVLSGLASIYVAQKKLPEAEAALRQVLAADPQNNSARAQLGRILALEGKSAEAAEELKKSLEAGGNLEAELQLGSLYAKAGNDVEAEHWFREAVGGFDQMLAVYEQRALKSCQQRPDCPYMEDIEREKSRSAEAHYALGSELMHEKKYPEAQRELTAAVQRKPELAEAYGNLAIVAAENQQYDLALRALDDRAKYLPEIPATYFLRATTYDHLKAIPKAVEYYQRFLSVDDGKFPDQEWQARHRLIALDPDYADKYRVKTK